MWSLSHLSVMALGVLVGITLEHRYGKQALEQMLGGAPALQSLYLQYVDVQRERGGYEQYRDALLDYNELWKLAQQNPLMSVFHDHSARMVNYIRLSRLESQQGTAAAARRYIELAVDDCAAIERQRSYCTPEELLELGDMFEQFQRDKARTKVRLDKEADENIWTGPKKF